MFVERWITPLVDLKRTRRGVRAYLRYVRDWRSYARQPDAEPLALRDAYPCLYDRMAYTPLDSHYFYQDRWALKAVKQSSAPLHIDVGSNIIYVGMLSALTEVIFIDIRPIQTDLDSLHNLDASILQMPFADNTVASLSCLHVAEHIGLGRYGDPLDPGGTRKAARELARVLKPGGSLYFSGPIGRPRVCYNAHRVHAPAQILSYFSDLKLASFAAVLDDGTFKPVADPQELDGANYACGLFQFTKL